MASTLEHFDVLVERGLKIIPLRENSKVPMSKGWNRNWSRHAARQIIQRFPECNIGLLLGDIVDVEGDSLSANLTIQKLVGDYPHPTYRSTKSTHHLFQTPDNALRIFHFDKIEFRGHGHQSVVPPSHHGDTIYQWLKTGFPIPEMPEPLVKFYHDKKNNRTLRIKSGRTRVWCANCGELCLVHSKRFQSELEVFKLLNQKWECRGCRVLDLRPAVRVIRRGR